MNHRFPDQIGVHFLLVSDRIFFVKKPDIAWIAFQHLNDIKRVIF